MARARARCYKVGYCLGAAEVHFARKECAHCKLARLGLSCAVLDEVYHQFARNIGRSVATNLHRILARIAVRSAHYGKKHLVERMPLHVENIAKYHSVAATLAQRLASTGRKNRGGDANGIATRNSHYAQRPTLCSGKGAYCIVVFHLNCLPKVEDFFFAGF